LGTKIKNNPELRDVKIKWGQFKSARKKNERAIFNIARSPFLRTVFIKDDIDSFGNCGRVSFAP
jgi:hypothetical protein